MNGQTDISPADVDRLYNRLKTEAEASGYHLNPDVEFTKELVYGLLVNERRYGYQACPCRLASGKKEGDLDIICPCDYRDADIGDYGNCYCGLYVSQAVLEGKQKVRAIPERRLQEAQRTATKGKTPPGSMASLPLPVWRCRVCGYLCARNGPPEVCPICKAKRDRFERFL
ncbi:MAG: ferredoxin:glutaredoxin reductase [Dehalococcoidales bacterium]|nr:ferredoxin:glutaredoxin reductase [Dehalococcoidales bacterium]